MKLPDVIGLALEEAADKFKESGFAVDHVVVAAPPAKPKPIGIPRVVRVSYENKLLQVVVAYQDYGKEV